MSDPIEPARLSAVHQFASSTEAYCTLLETHHKLTDDLLVQRCAGALAALYRDMLDLPDVDYSDLDRTWDRAHAVRRMRFLTESFGKSLYERLEAKQHDRYWLYFDPFDSASSLDFTLTANLREIYEHVRCGLEFYRFGTEQAFLYASYEWRAGGLAHWGQHLTDALRVLHEIIQDEWGRQPTTDEAEDDGE